MATKKKTEAVVYAAVKFKGKRWLSPPLLLRWTRRHLRSEILCVPHHALEMEIHHGNRHPGYRSGQARICMRLSALLKICCILQRIPSPNDVRDRFIEIVNEADKLNGWPDLTAALEKVQPVEENKAKNYLINLMPKEIKIFI